METRNAPADLYAQLNDAANAAAAYVLCSRPTLVPAAPAPARITPADAVYLPGAHCDDCGGEGVSRGAERYYRGRWRAAPCESCGDADREDLVCEGAACPGYRGAPCVDGPEAWLRDGAYSVAGSAPVCRGCAAVACGFENDGSVRDECILGALDAMAEARS